MKTRLVIIRHGNTFLPQDTPTRIGARTDLDLVETKKGTAAGEYLLKKDVVPDVIYSGPLKRHRQTAELICQAIDMSCADIKTEHWLNEIDYGVDENKTETEIFYRLGNGDANKGQQIIDLWNKKAVVPDGWLVNPESLKQRWHELANRIVDEHLHKTALLVSSNGTMRFSYVLDQFFQYHNLRVPTGGICFFEWDGKNWKCVEWGIIPT